ncbi:tyrosine-type recombinase/integrase [Ruminococcaceae bacterium OttesenSCG-928-D13]|nr:tyrosine-type recombinase/integrase [Ruminococcaceae bacterium OttesenSCG-928-D13]
MRIKIWYVVFSQKKDDGTFDTPWLPCDTEDEAIALKAKIEDEQKKLKAKGKKARVTNATRTVNQLAHKYIELVGKEKWGVSTYRDYISRYENYIEPFIGSWRVWDCTAFTMDEYFSKLKTQNAVKQKGKPTKAISAKVVNECHKFLKAMFSQAETWGMIDRNPCRKRNSTLPPNTKNKRTFWTREEFFHACECAEKSEVFMLLIAMHLSVGTTMREGEIAGLQWERCFISDEDIAAGNCRVVVDRELTRVSKKVMKELGNKGIKFVFPQFAGHSTTVLVLKDPKSQESNRTIWLPPTVARLMQRQKAQQDEYKQLYGDSYRDYGLVAAWPDGRPFEGRNFNKHLAALIDEHSLKHVVFHSLRHTSTTYKLKIAQGDVKLVQGDTGHANSQMVTDVYAEIMDEDRKINALRFESEFYSAPLTPQQTPAPPKEISAQDLVGMLAALQSNPDLVNALLQQAAQQASA